MDRSINLVLCDFGKLGLAYLETDPSRASRDEITGAIMSGEIDSEIVSIVEMNPAEGWARDVTEDVANALYDRCIRQGADPSSGAQALMERFRLHPCEDDAAPEDPVREHGTLSAPSNTGWAFR